MVGLLDHPRQTAGGARAGALEQPGQRPQEPGQRAQGARRLAVAGEVRGQDQQALDQRHQEHRDHHQRDVAHHLAEGTVDEHQGHEGGDRGQDREGHRPRHLPRAGDRRLERIHALLAVGVDVLADHDGVVDHDAERDDEGEQRDHVDGNVELRQQPDAAEKRDRNAQRGPEGQTQIEEQGQADEHQDQAQAGVVEQQTDALPEDDRGDLPGVDGHSGGQPATGLGDVLAHRAGHLEGVLVAGAVDLHQHRRTTVEARRHVGVLEAVDHRGRVAEPDLGAVATGQEHDVLELAAAVSLALGAQQDLAAFGLHRAAGQVERRPTHDVGDLAEGQPVPSQSALRDLDRDLVRRPALDVGLGDGAGGGEVVAHPLGEAGQGLERHVAGEHHAAHLSASEHLRDHRLLDLLREGVDAVHRRLDLLEDPTRVLAVLYLGANAGDALAGDRRDALDSLDRGDRLLHPQHDPVLAFGG